MDEAPGQGGIIRWDRRIIKGAPPNQALNNNNNNNNRSSNKRADKPKRQRRTPSLDLVCVDAEGGEVGHGAAEDAVRDGAAAQVANHVLPEVEHLTEGAGGEADWKAG